MRGVLEKMRECGKYVKMRDFPHDCVMVDTYGNKAFFYFFFYINTSWVNAVVLTVWEHW